VSGQVVIRDLTLSGPGRPLQGRGYSTVRTDPAAVVAPRFTVGAEITLEGSTTIVGGVDLSAADIGGLSVGAGCRLRSPGEIALDLTNAEIRSSIQFHPGVSVQGQVRLSRARVDGKLDLTGIDLSHAANSTLLDAYGVSVNGMVQLERLHAHGGRVVFNGATVQLMLLEGAQFSNGAGQSLNLRQATVHRSILLRGVKSEGILVLDGANIEGPVDLAGSTFQCPGPSDYNPGANAITAVAAVIHGGLHLGWERCEPSIDLTSVTTTVFADDAQHWPSRYTITGLTYERFERLASSAPDPWNVHRRVQWLDKAAFDAGAYEQAARVFRQHGYATEAEFLLIRQRDAARREATARVRATGTRSQRSRAAARSWLDRLFGRAVGYGYRPARAIFALLALLAVVVAVLALPATARTLRAADARGNVYATDGRLLTVSADDTPLQGQRESRSGAVTPAGTSPAADACGDGQIRCFNALLYGVDTVLPLVDLKQRATWYPSPHTPRGTLIQYVLSAATLLGWLLSTIVVLSFARLARTT
jgi:uncharacterized protein YjbI with pentapeptide repeats